MNSVRRTPVLLGACLGALALASCQRGPTMQPLPRRSEAWPKAEAVLVWHGRGEAFRLRKGEWKRTPTLDYDFTVMQRRLGATWESTKTLQRRHPDYDGSAGPRAQTYHFTVQYSDSGNFELRSTLGNGHGHADETFEEAQMVVDADISRYAPFNRYTIAQHYNYGEGSLRETVTLVKHRASGDSPWAKVEESALLFAPTRFSEPPTRRTAMASP